MIDAESGATGEALLSVPEVAISSRASYAPPSESCRFSTAEPREMTPEELNATLDDVIFALHVEVEALQSEVRAD